MPEAKPCVVPGLSIFTEANSARNVDENFPQVDPVAIRRPCKVIREVYSLRVQSAVSTLILCMSEISRHGLAAAFFAIATVVSAGIPPHRLKPQGHAHPDSKAKSASSAQLRICCG
jgi:hypothetical protein